MIVCSSHNSTVPAGQGICPFPRFWSLSTTQLHSSILDTEQTTINYGLQILQQPMRRDVSVIMLAAYVILRAEIVRKL